MKVDDRIQTEDTWLVLSHLGSYQDTWTSHKQGTGLSISSVMEYDRRLRESKGVNTKKRGGLTTHK